MSNDPSCLPHLERTILQLAALYYGRVGRTKLTEATRALGERMPDGRAIYPPVMKPILDGLIDDGWLVDTGQGLLCPQAQQAALIEAARAESRLAAMAEAIRGTLTLANTWGGSTFYRDYDELIRDLRLALILVDLDETNRLLTTAYQYFSEEVTQRHPLGLVEPAGIQGPLFSHLPPDLYQPIVLLLAGEDINRLALQPGMLEMLRDTQWLAPEMAEDARYRLAEYALLAGDFHAALSILQDDGSLPAHTLRAWAALVAGDLDLARTAYEQTYQALKKGTRKRNIAFHDLAGTFSLLPLFAANDFELAAERAARAVKDKDNPHPQIYQAWQRVAEVRLGGKPDYHGLYLPQTQLGGAYHLLFLLAIHWIEPTDAPQFIDDLKTIIRRAQAAGLRWIADQADALLARSQGKAPENDLELPLVDLLQRVEAWEPVLEALAALSAEDATPSSQGECNERLVWWLQPSHGDLSLQPRLQKRSKRGGWTGGRNVALERLANGQLDCMDEADHRICAGIVEHFDSWGWGRVSHEFDPKRSWPALVGHPRLFRADDPSVALEMIAAEPELHVRRSNDRLRVTLEPPLPVDGSTLLVTEESRGRLRLVSFSDAHRHIGQLLEGGLDCPLSAETQVRQAITQIAPLVVIHSDIGGDEGLPQVAGDSQPHLVLTPWDDGLDAKLLVRPMGAEGPAYPPGLGGKELTASGPTGKRQRIQRDLAEEQRRAAALTEACPALDPWEVEAFEWQLPEPGDALALLEQLQPLADEVTVEWPKGQNLSLAGHSDGGGMQLALRHRGDWFEASGELRVDEKQVLDLQRLLTLVASSNDRFLPLGEGRFLALTEGFRRRLEDLGQLADSAARKPRYHPLTAPLLEEIGDGLGGFKTDKAWRQQIERLQQAEQAPAAIPSTFEAELRDYQVDGYRWLMQLAEWGVGACLADDMGLGKTVQLLAVLAARATRGPSLVIAPTSVCANWLAEAQRFAPTLNPILFGPGDRHAQIEHAGPFDLLISSYGLMQHEIDHLTAREDWNCLILDEAQAIKNPATARAKAAFKLQADFRVATTGTPIENHLGELWSLFRFINAGLLGSRDAFNRRYAVPIERDDDHAARERLRRLVRPFILRRLKSSVLQELPPRTEIVLHVEPGAEEAAFYEALRRQALESLSGDQAPEEGQRFQVLAALTRLRRAACNPGLVAPETPIPSSKLALFLETVDELREGRHKALVFSQFVDHLSLVRKALDARNIPYQYLDGSTPAKQRAQRVNAFQAGEGDLFLISLKAGGFGLNLTAADYVIHLDPWWNPAVEDQASDRAHRIGQERPVTIYRLVSKGSIEERIISLHAHKRDLANGLLEGGDSAARLDTSELLELMREGP